MTHSPPDFEKVRRVELLISNILRIGVSVSWLVIVRATLITFLHHPSYIHSHAALERLTDLDHPRPHSLRAVFDGVGQARGQAIVMVGLLLLIATPVIRVGVSILAFVYQKDRVFAAITTVVLLLLLLSFVLGKAGG